MNKIKVLLVSRNAWNQTSSNTLINFFQDFAIDELAQVYCRDEMPDNNLCKRYFRISERQLIKSCFERSYFAGEKVDFESILNDPDSIEQANSERNLYNFFRTKRLTILLWLREVIWKVGKWKSPQLSQFVLDFNPDVIYTDAYDTFYTYNVLNHIRSIKKVPYVVFHCDDQVSFKQFSLSPLFWINRILLRNKVTKVINKAAINYCIIDKQKQVYESIFNKEFKILNKCGDFSNVEGNSNFHQPIKLHFSGNIYYGRWRTLANLVQVISKINKTKQQFYLEIYTSNPITKKIKEKLELEGTSVIRGFVPVEGLREVQKKSDVLLHVESFNLKERLLTSLSFSTKIVDYFQSGKCIMAIGWRRSASIDYLLKHDAAIVVTDTNLLKENLVEITNDTSLLERYAQQAIKCGISKHEKSIVLKSFRSDLMDLKSSY